MSYSERLLQQGTRLTRLAHRSRFSTVLAAVKHQHYRQALDYGCGDGWLLRIAYEQGLIQAGLGVDVAPYMLSACQETFAGIVNLQYCYPQQITEKLQPHSCDLVFCTETLEHVEHPDQVLEQMLFYCQPQAQLVISVPIEIGPSLVLKQMGRYFANLKGNYGYERYQPAELFAASVLWDVNQFSSSHSTNAAEKGHKGFDYRKIHQLIQQRCTIEREIFSPFPWLGNLLNSTVIWVCRAG